MVGKSILTTGFYQLKLIGKNPGGQKWQKVVKSKLSKNLFFVQLYFNMPLFSIQCLIVGNGYTERKRYQGG